MCCDDENQEMRCSFPSDCLYSCSFHHHHLLLKSPHPAAICDHVQCRVYKRLESLSSDDDEAEVRHWLLLFQFNTV